MASNYGQHVSRKVTPQSEAIPGSAQVPNSAGGFSFAVDDWTRLERFLILGSEGGSYYATERALTKENAGSVERCLDADPERAVNLIRDVSVAGRAPKNDPAIFALALASAHKSNEARAYAFSALPRVCRTGTHLFTFIEQVQHLRGWGRGLRNAVAAGFYELPDVEKVAFQALKYRQRGGWSQRDVIRSAHPAAVDDARRAVLAWIARPGEVDENGMVNITARSGGWAAGGVRRKEPEKREEDRLAPLPETLWAAVRLMRETDVQKAVELIVDHRLPREVVPTEMLNRVEVWEALLAEMPMTAMIRNLGKMTAVGLLKPMSKANGLVVDRLRDPERLRRARVHPLAILLALRTYQSGHGDKGSLTWASVQAIEAALDEAFYLAFDAVRPSGKRRLLALDVSSSMDGSFIAGTKLSAREGAAVMALVTNATEPETHVLAFQSRIVPLVGFTKRMSLGQAVEMTKRLPFGGTDCAQPMLWAIENKVECDSFEVFTDSETWAGSIHPTQALNQYRNERDIPAKLVVVGMVSNGFTIADPNDAGMLDVIGMDTSAPAVIADFVRGSAPTPDTTTESE